MNDKTTAPDEQIIEASRKDYEEGRWDDLDNLIEQLEHYLSQRS